MRNTINGSPGLWTAANSEVATPGALKQAVGCVIRRPGLIEKRRPYEQLSINADFSAFVGTAVALTEYNARLYLSEGTGTKRIFCSSSLTPTSAWTAITHATLDIGLFGKYGAIEMNRVLYDGTYKIDSDAGT